jgi:ABC-type transport system involved in Fe-S cluster assembly fused permease/ATPase subunit
MVFSVLPTLLEIALVTGFLVYRFDVWFGIITVGALLVYVGLTFSISEWRTQHRRQMNEMDSKANTRAIDSLLNYETVKYFGNERYEAARYDENLKRYEGAVVTSETSLGLLNSVQACVIATAVALLMWRAAEGIVTGNLTLGDLVMVNALLIQLYIPLNFLGVMYREIKQAFTDMEKMFRLLSENREVEDRPGAAPIQVSGGAVRFEHVDFSYDGERQIPPGARSRWSARAARASPRSRACSSASTTWAPGASRSTGRTSATCVRSRCARRSASFPRTPFFSTTRSTTTSRTAGPDRAARKSRTRRASRTSRTSSRA